MCESTLNLIDYKFSCQFSFEGAYNIEPRKDLSWSVFAYGMNLIYHWWILQAAALVSSVSLKNKMKIDNQFEVLMKNVMPENSFFEILLRVHTGSN